MNFFLFEDDPLVGNEAKFFFIFFLLTTILRFLVGLLSVRLDLLFSCMFGTSMRSLASLTTSS